MNWSREKRAVERAGERLREHRLADAGEVLDDQVPLGDEAEHDAAQRLRRRVHDAAEVRRRSRRRDRRATGARAALSQRRRSTSSSIAAAISSFGAFAISRSPAAPMSVTSLSPGLEADVLAPHVVEDEQVGVLVVSFSRARSRPALALVGREADEHLARDAAARRARRARRSSARARPSTARRPSAVSSRSPRRGGSRRRRRP